ncbi:sulfatase-like hydrolase/transferase [Halococcoides cellulosivorans]|uniref:sulfatase-like hydrolase/transferase n=1 Tax=Halococcoides cellulosivorans TaxID=1679096 RepID=UPI001F42B50C|nr:sulfatase-like hydrolase/transferase [Halococcoides cellulosivorans]
MLDTVRKDLFDELFDWLPGVAVENAYSPANFTSPAHASMFTGTYPSRHGVTPRQKSLDSADTVLAERLDEMGVKTVGISTNTHISRYWGFDRGFDLFSERSETGRMLSQSNVDWIQLVRDADSRSVVEVLEACLRSGHSVKSLWVGAELKYYDHPVLGTLFSGAQDSGATAVQSFIEDRCVRDPEFLFVNLMEAHSPYDPPEKYWSGDGVQLSGLAESLGTAPSTETIDRAYRAACRYLSDKYERIFDDIRDEYDYIITCSDHGELLGEHGYYAHEYGLYPELVQVPLVISGPSVRDRSVDNLLSLTGIFDLVVDLFHGATVRDALDVVSEDRCFTEFHGLDPNRRDRLISEGYSSDVLASHDTVLAGAADSAGYVYGGVDGFEGDSDDDALLSAAQEHRDRLVIDPSETDTHPADLPEDVRRQLDTLGYI